jgi:hypothetical protein
VTVLFTVELYIGIFYLFFIVICMFNSTPFNIVVIAVPLLILLSFSCLCSSYIFTPNTEIYLHPVINTKKYHVFAPMGRFQLELIYLKHKYTRRDDGGK